MSKSDSLQTTHLYKFSVFHLDVNDGLTANGEVVKLAPKILQTLTYFVENPGRLITKNELFDAVWTDSFVEDGALSFNISRLRKALAEYDPGSEFIETVSKRGFRFLAEVRRVQPDRSDSEALEILIERSEIREYVHEQEAMVREPGKKRFAHSMTLPITITVIALAVIVTILVVINLSTQKQENAELRSYDSLQSVDIVSWKSAGSSGFARYSSSHNGNMVAYSSTENGVSESIFIAQVVGGEKLKVTTDSWNNFSPVWSPNDQELAYASMRETGLGIYISPLLGGVSRLIAKVETGDLALRSWSKDGSAIYYELNGNLYSLNINDKSTLKITDLLEIKVYRRNFSVSADESTIAFCDEVDGQKDLWTMPFHGGERSRITNSREEEYRSSWHPDGKRIFYSVFRKGHYQIDVAYLNGNSPVQITRGDGKYELIDVSPDGTKLFYQKWLDKSDIWSVEPGNPEFSVASEPESEFWPSISPDGLSIAYQSNTADYVPLDIIASNVIVRDRDNTKVRHSFPGFGPKWLPDSRRIAFLRWQETEEIYNLWLFDKVSGTANPVTSNGVAGIGYSTFPFHQSQLLGFDWSPDSERFVYIDFRKNNVWLISSTGTHPINLTNNEDPRVTFRGAQWSPDGKRIAIVSCLRPATAGEKEEWHALISDGESPPRIFRTSKSLRFLGWSGDTLLFEASDDPIRAVPMNVDLLQVSVKGTEIPRGQLQNISALSMAMSPDGSRIAFVSRIDGKEDIYTAAVSNIAAKTKVTTNLDSSNRLGLIRWSPDGKTIFFDKQEEINMVSMFQNLK